MVSLLSSLTDGEGFYGAASIIICIFIMLLPIETSGRKLNDTIDQTILGAISSRPRSLEGPGEELAELETTESNSLSLDSSE
jgi:hypothetical protein